MSTRESLLAQLARFDEEAWAALANRGLLRRARKDLEVLQPSVAGEDDSSLRVRVGPHEVAFDARGPAQASCSCPSGSTCQHIIAAGLWLAGQEMSHTQQPPAEEDAPDKDRLHRELMALDPLALVAHAGRPGHRWATQFVADLDPEADVRIETGRHTSIGFANPRVTFRYMGGGLAALVGDSRLPAIEKYQVAAVLAYQRAHGVAPAPAEPPRGRATGPDLSLAESRTRLRASAARLLEDTVRLGLAHLSPGIHQRYETLAVWAQGAEYHRFALMLRRLADHVELQLDRSARADEHRLFDEAAVAYALVAALEAAGDDQPAARLIGTARNRYDAVRTMDLIGLGSVPWRAASGYRGLTTLFWWPAESRFLSLTDARPETLRGFDPRARYHSAGPWQGLATPSAATGARVRLTNAQLSGAGRLSGVERTHASVVPLAGSELAAELTAVSRWSDLEPGRARGALLDAPDPLRDWVVLRPAAFGPARFDPVEQVLSWPVIDDDGVELALEVAYSSESAHLIGVVEHLAAAGVAAGTLVVCRLRAAAGSVTAEPLSLVHPSRLATESPVEALHFSRHEVQGSGTPGAEGPPMTGAAAAALASPVEATPTVLPPQLVDLRSWLVRQAERGTGASSPGLVSGELLAHHRRLRDIGLDVFPVSTPDEDVATLLLRSHFLVQQVSSLLSR